MEPQLTLRTSGQGLRAAVCIRLGHGPFFCFLVLLTFEGAGRGASRTNCPWPPSVLSTGFTIQFGSLVPHLCVLIIAGRGGIREFNVKTVKLKKKKKSTHRKETHTVVRGC